MWNTNLFPLWLVLLQCSVVLVSAVTDPVCSRGLYAVLAPLSSNSLVRSYCTQRYPVSAITNTVAGPRNTDTFTVSASAVTVTVSKVSTVSATTIATAAPLTITAPVSTITGIPVAVSVTDTVTTTTTSTVRTTTGSLADSCPISGRRRGVRRRLSTISTTPSITSKTTTSTSKTSTKAQTPLESEISKLAAFGASIISTACYCIQSQFTVAVISLASAATVTTTPTITVDYISTSTITGTITVTSTVTSTPTTITVPTVTSTISQTSTVKATTTAAIADKFCKRTEVIGTSNIIYHGADQEIIVDDNPSNNYIAGRQQCANLCANIGTCYSIFFLVYDPSSITNNRARCDINPQNYDPNNVASSSFKSLYYAAYDNNGPTS